MLQTQAEAKTYTLIKSLPPFYLLLKRAPCTKYYSAQQPSLYLFALNVFQVLMRVKLTPRTYNFVFFNRNAFTITDTELKLIAAAAITGDNNKPKTGYNTPAAMGTPAEL